MNRLIVLIVCAEIIALSSAVGQQRVYPGPVGQAETPVAVNPTNPNNLVCAAITGESAPLKIGCYYSHDGGQTWQGTDTVGPPGSESGGDPVLAFDPDGNAFLVYQVYAAQTIYIQKSTDGGANWQPRVTIVSAEDNVDRPCVAVSPVRNGSSTFDIYVAYAQAEGPILSIDLSRSTDGGGHFSRVSSTDPQLGNSCQGSSLAVDPDGTIILSWAEYQRSQKNKVNSIRMKRSTDGGSTFQNEFSVPTIQIGDYDGNGYSLKEGKVPADSYPRVACAADASQGGRTVLVVWSGRQAVGGSADLLLVRGRKSTQGFIWDPTTVIDQSDGDQWMPAISIAPDSVASVLYYSSGRELSDPIYTYLRYSTNGGSSFSNPPIEVGPPGGFTITELTFLGDYHGLASSIGKAYGVWCEARNHAPDALRQAYFRSVPTAELAPPSGYAKVQFDQVDESGVSFDKIGRWNQNAFTSYMAGVSLILGNPSNQVVRARLDFKEGTTQKHYGWNRDNDVSNHRTIPVGSSAPLVKSTFKTADGTITVKTDLEGTSITGDTIQIMDPWLRDTTDAQFYESPYGYRSLGMESPFRSEASAFTMGISTKYKGVFLGQSIVPENPFYSVSAQFTQTIGDATSYFQRWTGTGVLFQDSTQTETGVVFNSPGAVATALYKGHLRTGVPSLADAKNQRRVVSASVGAYVYWYMVYESLGDVWLAYSADNGSTWLNEERLNVNTGHGSNPSISNVFRYSESDYPRIMLAWVEQAGSSYEVHFQTLLFGTYNGHYHYGWNSQNGERSSSNHRTFAETPLARGSGRPVLQLDQLNEDMLMTWACETNSGVSAGTRWFDGNGYNTLCDLDGSIFQVNYTVSTNVSDMQPVIISYPAAFGFAKRKVAYFIASGYAAGKRIVEFDFSSGNKTVLSTGYLDYTFYSLQGAPNPTSASFALVAEGTDTYLRSFVNYYVKPTYYGSSPPSLATAYLNLRQPTIMVEATSAFGSPIVEIDIKSTLDSAWYKSTGSTSLTAIGTNVAGIFTRANVGAGDRASEVTRTTVVPARIDHYSGSGPLSKGDATLALDVRAVRTIKDETRGEHTVVLDFSDARLSIIDSLEHGQTLCAVEFLQVGSGGWIVGQEDSCRFPLGLELLREGSVIHAFAPSAWGLLTESSMPEIQAGDIICLKLTGTVTLKWGYTQVILNNTGIQRAGWTKALAGDALMDGPVGLEVHPNPFNPSTKLEFTLPEPSQVSLTVYDLVGRQVAQLCDGYSEAGRHTLSWNASQLASGLYLARYVVKDAFGAAQVTIVKKLIFVK